MEVLLRSGCSIFPHLYILLWQFNIRCHGDRTLVIDLLVSCSQKLTQEFYFLFMHRNFCCSSVMELDSDEAGGEGEKEIQSKMFYSTDDLLLVFRLQGDIKSSLLTLWHSCLWTGKKGKSVILQTSTSHNRRSALSEQEDQLQMFMKLVWGVEHQSRRNILRFGLDLKFLLIS